MNRQSVSMSDHRDARGQRMPLPTQHDAPWEHVLPSQRPHLASQARLEEGVFISRATSLELPPPGDLHGQLNSSESASPMSAYSSGSIHSHGYESGDSPPPSAREWEHSDRENSSWSLPSLAPRGTSAGATSPSSAGNFTETSSNREGFSETAGSNGSSPYSGASEQDDSGAAAEPEARSISQGHPTSNRPRPFSRKSKAGNQHTVTPSAAGPHGGFICSFKTGESTCGRSFKLPSDMRAHLIEKHMSFSPFQCETCKRVYTRKSLYTRHLKGVDQTGSQQTRGHSRQCPNRAMEADDAFYYRKETYAALWAIQTTQEQVEKAVNTIKTHNGMLPGRRRRTQNQNETEPPETRPPIHGSTPPFGAHPQVSSQIFTPHQSPPYTQPYPSGMPRGDYFSQRVPPAFPTPTETGATARRSPLAGPAPYQSPAPYQPTQEAPMIPPGDGRGYINTDAGQPLYGPTSIYAREYMAQLEQSDNIDPNVLQHVTTAPHRTAWETPRQDYPAWPATRTDGHGQRVVYSDQGFKQDDYHYQSGTRNDESQPNVFNPAAIPRNISTPDQFHERSPKTG